MSHVHEGDVRQMLRLQGALHLSLARLAEDTGDLPDAQHHAEASLALGLIVLGVAAFVVGSFFPTILAMALWAYTMYGAGITPALVAAGSASATTWSAPSRTPASSAAAIAQTKPSGANREIATTAPTAIARSLAPASPFTRGMVRAGASGSAQSGP